MATLNDLLVSIQAKTLAAIYDNGVSQILADPGLHTQHIKYWLVDGDVIRDNTVLVIVKDLGVDGAETAYWHNRIPEPLRPVDAPITPAATEAQVLAKLAAHADGLGVDMVVEIDAVKAILTGLWDDGTGTMEERRYVLYRDANDAVVIKRRK